MLEIFVLSQVFECTHAFTVPSRYLHHGQHIYKEHLNFPRRKKEIKSFDLLNRVFDGKMHSNAERENEWDIGDDWDRLSSHNVANSNFDTSSIFNVDVASQAAIELEKMMKEEREQEPNGIRCDLADDEATLPTNTHHEHQSVEETDFINNVIDLIQTESLDPKGPALYDTVFHSQNSFNDYTQSLSFTDEMGQEISLLVRCNESPHDLLVEGGRALPVLDDEEKYNISQLLEISQATGTYEPTDFLINSVNSIFQTHARRKINIPNDDGGNNDSNVALDYKGVAAWLSQSLKEKVGQHDKRIPVLMSKYAKYGSGIITREQFQKLYLDAVMIGLDESNKKKEKQNSNFMKMMKLKQATLKEVWRDFESHGIVPPVVAIREELQTKIDAEFGNQSTSKGINALDECEIHEWNSEDNSDDDVTSTSETNEQAGINTKKSSHELVELSSDEKTPKRLRDGEFGKFLTSILLSNVCIFCVSVPALTNSQCSLTRKAVSGAINVQILLHPHSKC